MLARLGTALGITVRPPTMPEARLHTPMARSVLLASDLRRQGSILSTAFTLATDSTPSIMVKVKTTSAIVSHSSGLDRNCANAGRWMPSSMFAGMAMRRLASKPSTVPASTPKPATMMAAGTQRHSPCTLWRRPNISARLMAPTSATSHWACASCCGRLPNEASTDLDGMEGAPSSAGSWRTMIMMPMAASMASTTVAGSMAAYCPARRALSSSCSTPVRTTATSTSG